MRQGRRLASLAAGLAVLAACPAGSAQGPSLSAYGRYVAFETWFSLARSDTNGVWDVFVRDRATATTEQVSVGSGGEQEDGHSYLGSLSADGRYVTFYSLASNLVPDDTNKASDVFVRDRVAKTTERVSVGSSGEQGNRDSMWSSLSSDGRYVAFFSGASNLFPHDTNDTWDVFVRDRVAKTTELVSVGMGGEPGNGLSYSVSLSADGRYVAFFSGASNLVAGDTNGAWDVFVRDRVTGTTERVSVGSGGEQGKGESLSPTLSTDGRYVTFESDASNLVPGDTNYQRDVFLRDRTAGTTERVSVGSGGEQGDGYSTNASSPSADGRYVAFQSRATNLVPGDTDGGNDVFVHDRITGATERVSVDSEGAQGTIGSGEGSGAPSLSADGRFVAFYSDASNLVSGDTDGLEDVFVRDRREGTTERVSVATTPARAGRLMLLPSPARAGRRLSAVMAIGVGDTPVAAAVVTCTATIAGRRLPARSRSYRAGVARCGWTLPSASKGKTIRGSIRATTSNGPVARSFRSRIR